MAKAKAKTRSQSRRRMSFTIPLAPIAGMVPLAAESINVFVSPTFATVPEKIRRVGQLVVGGMTGYDFIERRFRGDLFSNYGIPIYLGNLAHFIASKTGINRMLGRAKIPFIRI